MNSHIRVTLLMGIFILLQSCANHRLNYSKSAQDWKKQIPTKEITSPVEHSIYLIGDAGDAGEEQNEKSITALKLLKRKLSKAPENTSVIFLGNNIYPAGMPPKSKKVDRKKAEERLNVQLDALENFKGQPLFIPGNHDWQTYGVKGIRRQEKYVEKYLNQAIEDKEKWGNYFLPDKGCAGPQVVEINKKLVVVVVDTQWWLLDWAKEPQINEDCEAKNRYVFTFQFEEIMRKHRNKNIVVALHHPFYSGGTHGGYFTAKQHIFPLTDINKDLFIPLPILGSAVAYLRSAVGSKQDLAHADYKEMKKAILAGVKKNGRFIFVSGHEHNLQYIQEQQQHFIVSGAGSRKTPAKIIKGSEFAYGERGFSKIDFHEDGTSWVEFWVVDETNLDGKMVFRKKMTDKLAMAADNMPTKFPEYEAQKDSIESKVLTYKVEKKGFIQDALLGKHYRDAYLAKYKFPVLDLSTFKGGLTTIKRGGGNQTNSLRMQDPNGQQYVMRSMTKDASRFIPYPFNEIGGAQAFVEDNFLSTHPFAATVIPSIANAANIYHTNPNLYYIPKQPVLGQNNDLFGGEIYLVEERAAKNWSNQSSFGHSKKIISTPDVVGKVTKNGKHLVDQNWTIRTRLFDHLIGDWDRHDDQWRWASFKDIEKGKTIYRPVPRDRDQAFSKYDGWILGIARLSMPSLKQLRPYSPNISNIKWANYNARQFDRLFLNQLQWEEWQTEVKYLQQHLTDEVIEQSFKNKWPEPSYTFSAGEVMAFMKSRRDHLMEIARKHYELMAKEVDVVGTEKKDVFEVERKNDRETLVKVFRLKDKERARELIYERTFYTAETKEIRLIGLGGKDRFFITGTVKKGILIRAIGGLDEDQFIDQSFVEGVSSKTKIYDAIDEPNEIDLGKEAKDLRSTNREENIYNRRDYHYDYDFLMPFPFMGFNPDDGVFLGAKLLFVDYGFKKDPYKAMHSLETGFAFSTNAFYVDYVGDFLGAFGQWDFLLNTSFRTPQYTNNYFGMGNDTPNNTDDLGLDFYRVRQQNLWINPNLKRRFAGENGAFIIGPVFEQTKIEKNLDRFVATSESGLTPDIFDNKFFAGADVQFNFENVDDFQFPRRGIRFHSNLGWRANLKETDKNFVSFGTDLTMYVSFGDKQNIVYASRIGAEHRLGDFEFFQAAILSGNDNLRGYRANRFYGRTNFYQQNDIRIKLFTSQNKIVPFSFGISGGFDWGRVWSDKDLPNGDGYQTSAGGGIWISPVDFLVLSGTLFRSDEWSQLVIGVGFGF